MPSGKKSKQMRRAAATAPPRVQSKGASRRREANPRVLAAIGGVVVLVVVGIVLGVTLSGGGGGKSASDLPAVGTLTDALPGAAEVNNLFKGIPQKGTMLGSPSAPVTMVEYIDLQCPFCQQFETEVMPNILQRYVRTNKVKVEVRILDFIGPDSGRGRNAMIAAAKQNKAFNFAELLYFNQGTENTGWLDDAMVGQAASSIPGLKVHELLNERSSGSVKSQAKTFDTQGTADQVSGTPTLFVGKSGTKGKLVTLATATDQQTLVSALDAALE